MGEPFTEEEMAARDAWAAESGLSEREQAVEGAA